MGGRSYDYNLGRFLSVDPIIQAPTNSQSHNPYSYVLNNPLSGVLGFSQLLIQKDVEGKFRHDIERIVDCAGHCQKIVQNLLSFARPGNPERKPVGLNGILEKTLDLLESSLHADNIEVEKEITPNLPYVLADFHQMQQVLTNLINNALQAMSTERGSGKLRLGLSARGIS